MTVWKALSVAVPVLAIAYAIGFAHGFLFLATAPVAPSTEQTGGR